MELNDAVRELITAARALVDATWPQDSDRIRDMRAAIESIEDVKLAAAQVDVNGTTHDNIDVSSQRHNLIGTNVAEELMYSQVNRQACATGWHAWTPWLAIHNDAGRLLRYVTFCSNCKHEEQYDV